MARNDDVDVTITVNGVTLIDGQTMLIRELVTNKLIELLMEKDKPGYVCLASKKREISYLSGFLAIIHSRAGMV